MTIKQLFLSVFCGVFHSWSTQKAGLGNYGPFLGSLNSFLRSLPTSSCRRPLFVHILATEAGLQSFSLVPTMLLKSFSDLNSDFGDDFYIFRNSLHSWNDDIASLQKVRNWRPDSFDSALFDHQSGFTAVDILQFEGEFSLQPHWFSFPWPVSFLDFRRLLGFSPALFSASWVWLVGTKCSKAVANPLVLLKSFSGFFPKFFTKLSRWRVPSKSQQLSLMAIILVLILKAIDLENSSLVCNALFTLDVSKFEFKVGFVLIFSGQLIWTVFKLAANSNP
jgi:hypothetical protein